MTILDSGQLYGSTFQPFEGISVTTSDAGQVQVRQDFPDTLDEFEDFENSFTGIIDVRYMASASEVALFEVHHAANRLGPFTFEWNEPASPLQLQVFYLQAPIIQRIGPDAYTVNIKLAKRAEY